MEESLLQYSSKHAKENQHFYVLADKGLMNKEVGGRLEEELESLSIGYKFSEKTFNNSLLWLSAKINPEDPTKKFNYETELCMVYYNTGDFVRDYLDDKLRQDLKLLKECFNRKGVKILIVFDSVAELLSNNPDVDKEEYSNFLIELTVSLEFDYIEVKNINEVYVLIREIQECLEKKSTRKELLMGNAYIGAKGAKYSKKAVVEGFSDKFSKYWIGMIMSIPGVSENKAIAIAKKYPTMKSLMKQYYRRDISEAQKKKIL